MMLYSTGILVYNPNRPGLKSNNQWWVVLETCEDLCRYYRHHLLKHRGIKLAKPAWGAHISIVRGTAPPNQEAWEKHHGETIQFRYSEEVRQSGDTTGWDRPNNYFFLDCYSDRLAEIRLELGFDTTPKTKYHMTIGRTYDTSKN